MLIACIWLGISLLSRNSHAFVASPRICSSCVQQTSSTLKTISKDVETLSDEGITDMLDNNISELIEDSTENDEAALNDKKFMKLAIEIAKSK
jgi:hypothetical protein